METIHTHDMDREAIQERFGILGTAPSLHRVLDRIRQVARTDVTVLIQGESGTGKELVAQAIHQLGPRKHKPLVVVNCGAIPEGLIESELFGAEKGAYTGATEKRTGYFEEADASSVFLDEIGEMPPQAQVRLLRVLETGAYARVGSSVTRQTDARVIAATNRNLADDVRAGRFREDLYYRLATVVIDLPALRERREDILLLFEHFLHRTAQRYDTAAPRLTADARRLLEAYAWPGNVRELRNVAEQSVVLLRGDTLGADDLRPYLRGVSAPAPNMLLPALRGMHAGGQADAHEDGRERELLYRALLELRMDVRDLKEQLGQLVTGFQVTREDLDGLRATPRGEGFVIVREGALRPESTYEPEPTFEDAPFEIADVPDRAPEAEEEEPEIRPLEEVERELIARALGQFDGNRRQTAQALGISERTLYRKIKELEAQGFDV